MESCNQIAHIKKIATVYYQIPTKGVECLAKKLPVILIELLQKRPNFLPSMGNHVTANARTILTRDSEIRQYTVRKGVVIRQFQILNCDEVTTID